MKFKRLRSITLFFALLTILGTLSPVLWGAVPNIKENSIHLPKPTASNKLAATRVTQRLTTLHYRKIQLDDVFSLKILNRYLDDLDYNHDIFLQSDIDNIRQQYGDKFDDELRVGDLRSAFAIYDLMNKRRYERYQYALSLLSKEPKLTADDKIEVDRTKAPWFETPEQLNVRWKKRVENDIIFQKLKGKKWSEIKSKLEKRYNLAIKRLTQTSADDVTQTFLNAFARSLDPHTSYLAPRAAKSFNESMNLSIEGIGATLQMNDDETIIRSLVPGSPAAKSKQLKPGDKIVGVGQSKNKIEDIIGWRLSDVVDKVKGKKGTKVYLEVEPEKGGKSRIVVLKRDKIRLEEQAAKLTVVKIRGENIGVIKIPGFYIGITRDVRKLLVEAKEKKINALIIDLRGNTGGLLTEVIELCGLFIADGAVVQVRDAKHNIKIYQDPDRQLVYDGALFVMIDRFSASASEIFAAAMQDYNRAIVLGQNSYGKGTVQQNRPLFEPLLDEAEKSKELGIVQYTIQKFYRINGGSTQIKGVTPDIYFPSLIDEKEYGENAEKNALPWDKISTAFYMQLPSIKKYLPPLIQKHRQRMAEDPEFKVVEEDIAIQAELNKETHLSLQYTQRKKAYDKIETKALKDLNARFKREGKPLLTSMENLPKDYEAPDFYLKEAENIAVDFLQLKN